MPAMKTMSPNEAIAAATNKIADRRRNEREAALTNYRRFVSAIASGKSLTDNDSDALYEAMQTLALPESALDSDCKHVKTVLDNTEASDPVKSGAKSEALGATKVQRRFEVQEAREQLAAAENALCIAESENSCWSMACAEQRQLVPVHTLE